MNPREYDVMFAAEGRHWWYVALHREIAQHLAQYPPTDSRKGEAPRLLDAGCGTGGLLAYLGSRPPWWLVGIDRIWDGVWLSHCRGLSRLVQGSVNVLPFREGTFDVVTSIDVLYHQGVDDREALREAARVLKPGGFLIVHVPAFEWLRSEHDVAIATRKRYTRRELEALLTETGFVIQRCGYRNVLLFPAMAILRLLKRRRRTGRHARSDVGPVPPVVNTVLLRVLEWEARLTTRIRPPFGLSIFCIAQRPLTFASA